MGQMVGISKGMGRISCPCIRLESQMPGGSKARCTSAIRDGRGREERTRFIFRRLSQCGHISGILGLSFEDDPFSSLDSQDLTGIFTLS